MTIEPHGPAGHRPAMDAPREPPEATVAGGSVAFEGAGELARVLRDAMAHAAGHATHRVCWCDENYAAWPLGEAAWVAQLTRWARAGGRELVMIARDWAGVERRHPRFVDWRRDWAHLIQCLAPDETRTATLPTLWIDAAGQAIRVLDHATWRGRAGVDRFDRQHARAEFDAISQRAGPGSSAVTLGL